MKKIKTNTVEFYKPILYPFSITLLSIGSVYSLQQYILTNVNLLNFSISVMVFIAIFLSLSYIADAFLHYDIRRLIKENMNIFKK